MLVWSVRHKKQISIVLQKLSEETNVFMRLTNRSMEIAAMVKTSHYAEVCEGVSVECRPEGTDSSKHKYVGIDSISLVPECAEFVGFSQYWAT